MPVNNAIYAADCPQKFIYTVRHGKAHHNALADEYSKPIAWRFLGKLHNTFELGLTATGVRDAQQSGRMLRELMDEEGAPRPAVVYTSPLRRCIQTSMYAIAEMRPGPVTLVVKEGLREWKGYDHNHESDRRDTTPAIVALFGDLRRKLGVDVVLEVDGAQDAADAAAMRETYVDVDRRVRAVLDDVFADDGADCAMLVLHNRSNKSVLRVMGHTQDEVNKLDMENCAVLGYLLGREPLDTAAALARWRTEEGQWLTDRDLAEAEKAERHEQAARDIAEYRRTDVAKLWRLREYLAGWADEGDGEAAKALLDLFSLAPELRISANEVSR